jgi:hypothetical protein
MAIANSSSLLQLFMVKSMPKINTGNNIFFMGEPPSYFKFRAVWARCQDKNDGCLNHFYMDAAASIGKGQPVGLFSDVFCQTLTAAKGFIETNNIKTKSMDAMDMNVRDSVIPEVEHIYLTTNDGQILLSKSGEYIIVS